MFADWEYNVTNEPWDNKIDVNQMKDRLASFNAVNENVNVVSFHWTYMHQVGDLINAKSQLGWDKKKMMSWTVLQVFKREQKGARGVSFNTDMVCFLHFHFRLDSCSRKRSTNETLQNYW